MMMRYRSIVMVRFSWVLLFSLGEYSQEETKIEKEKIPGCHSREGTLSLS
jgi:hypothetical protein